MRGVGPSSVLNCLRPNIPGSEPGACLAGWRSRWPPRCAPAAPPPLATPIEALQPMRQILIVCGRAQRSPSSYISSLCELLDKAAQGCRILKAAIDGISVEFPQRDCDRPPSSGKQGRRTHADECGGLVQADCTAPPKGRVLPVDEFVQRRRRGLVARSARAWPSITGRRSPPPIAPSPGCPVRTGRR
jgi:hypothetical protein